jgi:competence protein ComEC
MNWREIPMARLLLPLMLGILLKYYWPGYAGIAIGAMVACFALLVVLWKRKTSFSRRWHYGLLLNLFLFSQGYALDELCTGRMHASLPAGQAVTLAGQVDEVKETSKRYRLFLKLKGIVSRSDTSGRHGRIMLYLEKSPQAASLKPGDVILCKATLQPIPSPLNPHAFDYQHYLGLQRISLQAFIGNEDWVHIGYQANIKALCDQWRNGLLHILAQHITTKNEFAVGAALSLGYKSALSSEIRTAYTSTGAMHVLAVSGLHVGLVQLLLSWCLGLIKPAWRYWSGLKVGVVILSIWSFALLTGASPSVLRAASMFSFLAIGLELKRPVNIYNTLAVSAFLLLCVNPMLLFEIGFQLSYLAVLGIVYFQPKVYRCWFIQNRLGDYLWKLVSVSIAAQLTTLPISLYYFHQFPVYFLLSGLVVVPAAALILSCSLLLFALHWVPVLSAALGYVLFGVLYATNALIFLIQQLPAALLKGVWVSGYSVAILYGVMLCLVAAINTRKYRWVLSGMLGLVLLCLNVSIRKCRIIEQQAFVIYHVERHTLVDLFHHTQLLTIKGQELDEKGEQFAAGNHRWFRGASKREVVHPGECSTGKSWMVTPFFIQATQQNIFMPTAGMPDCSGMALPVDVCLLTKNAPADIETWLACCSPKQIVIDGSVNKYRTTEWLEICGQHDIPVHVTRQNGAFVME